jgi:digeranylgeranylglycerophospholipid reductase
LINLALNTDATIDAYRTMSASDRDYDIIVAGGGLSGMIAACSAAHYSTQTLRILVVDRNDLESLGRKTLTGWICGDAVGKKPVDYMNKNINISWQYPEIEHPVRGVVAYSPDHQTKISFDGEGYILNRKLLPQKQASDAVSRGVDLRGNIVLRNLVTDGNKVIGVEGDDVKEKVPFRKTSSLVIDCTGVTSVLRTNLAVNSYIQRKIDRDDLEATGRYICTFDVGIDDKTYFDPEYCIIHLDQDIAPGGYAWVFPKGSSKANIGLGVQQKALDQKNKKTGNKVNLKALIDNYLNSNPAVHNPKLSDDDHDSGNSWGTWQVSVRRQNDCMVANGYLLVGDSAWMPKPLDAGGIGPAIIAATLAGKHAVNAIQRGDVSEAGLWEYNKDFIDEYGYKTAGLEVFRRMLQGLSNDEINYGMKHFISRFDVEKITNGEHPEFGLVSKMGLVFASVMNQKLASSLKRTAEVNALLVKHYNDYPSNPDGFTEWQNDLMKIMENPLK